MRILPKAVEGKSKNKWGYARQIVLENEGEIGIVSQVMHDNVLSVDVVPFISSDFSFTIPQYKISILL